MRLGLVLEPAPAADELASLTEQALAAEAAGFALGWLPAVEHAALVAATALAMRTSVLRLAACVHVGGHPLEIAEATAVADNCANGRIVLVLEAVDDADPLGETADAILAALTPRPFRHVGARWSIPANLPEHDQHEQRIVLRPPTVQIELPVWLAGPGSTERARERGLAHVGRPGAAGRLARPDVIEVDAAADGGFDADALVSSLRVEQGEWGLDTAVLRLPSALAGAARLRAIEALAAHVAPRVVMHELPPGLEAHWRATLGD